MDSNIRREMILEHYQHPINKGLIDDSNYIIVNTNNDSCIDNLDIMFKITDGIIEDIKFDGEACAISTSATSVMIKTLLGKSVMEAREILNNYENMINEEPYDKEKLEELNLYDEVYKQPNRKKCALLPFEALKKVLK